MPIDPVRDPVGARRVAERAFDGRGGLDPQRNGFPVTSVVGALPLYSLSAADLLGSGVERARATGWRYVRVADGSEQGEIVEVVGGEKEPPAFASYAEGRIAANIRDAGMAADAALAAEDHIYQPRILRLPEIHMEALWLHVDDSAANDRFLGLPDGQSGLADDVFLEVARARATAFDAQTTPDHEIRPEV